MMKKKMIKYLQLHFLNKTLDFNFSYFEIVQNNNNLKQSAKNIEGNIESLVYPRKNTFN